MSTSTSAASGRDSADRLSAGWLMQVLKDRGLPCPSPQEARRAVDELTPEQRREVVHALERLMLGSDDAQEMELMSLVWRSVSPATTQVLRRAGVHLDAAGALSMFRQHPAAVPLISRALGQGPQAEAALEELRGLALPWHVPPLVADAPEPPQRAASARAEAPVPPPRATPEAVRAAVPPVPTEPEPAALSERPFEPEAPRASTRPARPQARAYSTSAAILFELDTLRTQDGEPRSHTVSIEAASGRGGEGYDWAGKIIFQCTLRELPQVLACLMGWTRELEFKGHGSAQDKRLLMRHQGDSVYVKLMQGRRAVSLPVHRDDLYPIVLVCLRALSANDPDLPVPTLLEVIRQLAQARTAE